MATHRRQVVFVHDSPFDSLWLRSLRVAQMLCHRLPDLSTLGATAGAAAAAAATSGVLSEADAAPVVEYRPRASFVFNRLPPTAFGAVERGRLCAMMARLVEQATPGQPAAKAADGATALEPGPEASKARDRAAGKAASKADGKAAGKPEGEVAETRRAGATEVGAAPLIFLLPDSDEGRSLCSAHAGFRAEAEQMRDDLLALPRRPFSRPLSEKEWLRGVSRMWSLILRSATVSEYNRALQKLHAFA